MELKKLGQLVRWVDSRNKGLQSVNLLGISIDKYFMPSVANVIGTDLSSYKVVSVDQFACNPMHVGRDEKMPVALYMQEDPSIVSPAYFVFEVIDSNEILPEYLMLWFRRKEFDREVASLDRISDEERRKIIESGEYAPSYMWNVNGWLCSKLGLTVESQTQECVPQIAKRDIFSSTLNMTVKKGDSTGMSAVVTTKTKEGITLETQCIRKSI